MRRKAAIIALAVSATLPSTPAFAQARAVQKEIALGRSLAKEMERGEKILLDAAVTEYVARLAGNIARHAGSNMPLAAKVIDSQDARAIAFPGGFLYLTRGLIARTETEAELAGVVAHEIAHIIARHGMRQLSRDANSPQPEVPLVFAGGWIGVCTRFAAGNTVPVTLLATLRGFGAEADSMAVRYLRAAGYDPLAMIEFFNKLRYEEPRLAQTWSSDDLLALRTYVEDNLPPNPEYIVTTTAFGRIRNRFAVEAKPPSVADLPSLRRVPGQLPFQPIGSR